MALGLPGTAMYTADGVMYDLVVRHRNSRLFSPALAVPDFTFRTPQYPRYSENLNACQERRLLAEK